MSLRRYAIRVVETRGLGHSLQLRNLRNYLKEHTDESLIKEIRDIREVPLLRALFEAGLRSPLMGEVLKQLEKFG